MLIGQYQSKLTEGNRIAVPKKIREELGDRMIVARWYESCLVLVSFEKWRKFLNRLIGKPGILVSPVRDVDRFILASAFEISVDNQGRFVLPDSLIEYSQIKSEVVFIGLGDRAEIWSQEKWEVLEKVAERKAAKAIEVIAKRGRIDVKRNSNED